MGGGGGGGIIRGKLVLKGEPKNTIMAKRGDNVSSVVARIASKQRCSEKGGYAREIVCKRKLRGA